MPPILPFTIGIAVRLNCWRSRQCVEQRLQNAYVVDASPRCHQYERQRHLFQLTVTLDERMYREQLSKRFAHHFECAVHVLIITYIT